VLGALDWPGEWFHDRKTGTLYFYPPEGKVADGEVRVPVVDHLITVRGTIPYPHGYLNVKHHGTREQFEMPPYVPPERPVAGLVFTGFRLDGARQDGIRMIGARNCAVVACRVTNVGGVGINLGGVTPAYDEVGNPRVVPAEGVFGGVGGAGQDLLFNDPCQGCVVRGNDVWSVGSDGIFLYGTQNVAENNHVYDTGLFDKDCACINLWGERNAARRNELHDAPRNAVFLKGTDNVVELNDIHNTMLETCDGGAIRMCQRNLTLRGNVIRHNRIVDTLGYGYPRGSNAYQSPYYSWGVYLDDYTCGTEVIGNVIVRTGRGGVMLHGGSDNVVANNVIVDAGGYAVEVAPIREPVTGNLVRRNIIVCDGDRAFVYRCTRWLEGAVHFALNLVWPRGAPARVDLGRGGARYDDWETWQDAGLDEGSKVADPRFKDADDYRLRDDSPALDMGFTPIPVGDIGCYPDEARATWPLEVDPDLVREDPVLYVAPVRPLDEDFELDLVGKPPRHGDVIAFPKAPIVVTDEVAASGQHSLKIVDAPGLPRV
ncbi:MAG: right-handed parallel beta-helix repeat-containing protein, partial [Armatimonadota bacterium]